jgi:hypothetical protein
MHAPGQPVEGRRCHNVLKNSHELVLQVAAAKRMHKQAGLRSAGVSALCWPG